MMHCSYQLSPLTTLKKGCIKCRRGANIEKLSVENFFSSAAKKAVAMCLECPIRKGLIFS
jgi:hypothetical protein